MARVRKRNQEAGARSQNGHTKFSEETLGFGFTGKESTGSIVNRFPYTLWKAVQKGGTGILTPDS
jgi:hypothetical protein